MTQETKAGPLRKRAPRRDRIELCRVRDDANTKQLWYLRIRFANGKKFAVTEEYLSRSQLRKLGIREAKKHNYDFLEVD